MKNLINSFREMFIVPEWVRAGEISAKGSELRYWKETGLVKGSDIYDNYLRLFKLDKNQFKDQVVADFGAGPFGGILGRLDGIREGYPIDVLANEYNKMARSKFPIVPFYEGRSTVVSASCDAIFCTNMIDHTPYPDMIVAELSRILRPRGRLFVHLHLRKRYELNKVHPFPWSEKKFRKAFKNFHITSLMTDFPDWVNGNELHMLWAECEKPDQGIRKN